MLQEVKEQAKVLGEPVFNDEGDDGANEKYTLSFQYFLNVNKLVITYAIRQAAPVMADIKAKRREALENYEDDLFEDLVMQTVLVEQKTIEVFRSVLYSQLDLRPRDLIKAKVKYLMDPEYNAKFEAELGTLKDAINAAFVEIEESSEEIDEEKCLKAWRTLELANISKEQKVSDYGRSNPNLPLQMRTNFAQIENIKLDDHFFNDTGLEV